MTQLINAELITARIKLEEAATSVAALHHTPNIGLVLLVFWLDHEINPPEPAPKEVA